MAITGNNEELYKANLSMDSNSYSNVVQGVQGKTVHGDWDYYNRGYGGGSPFKPETSYEKGTVAGKYVLKGRAGITPQFYKAFSDAFDEYKTIIENDLKDLETNPNIHQAFSGTEIESAVKRLIEAVDAEARDYLFKLEQAEKTVINSVKAAFEKQQANVGSSMNKDTSILEGGNTTDDAKTAFAKQDIDWGGTPDGNSGSVPRPVNNVAVSTVNRNLTY